MSLIIKNKKAFHNYEVLEKLEAGIQLTGTEVKSLRDGKVQMADCYGVLRRGEVFIVHMHIAHYGPANQQNHRETRDRKLLLHRREIDRLAGKMQQKQLTLVPLSLYWKNNKVKVELGLCRGKKQFDKRETQKKKDAQREIDRALKNH